MKSIIKLHLASCNTEKKENLLKSTKRVPVQIHQQQKKKKKKKKKQEKIEILAQS